MNRVFEVGDGGRWWIRRILVVVGGLTIVSTLLSVNTAPSITNDSLVYLDHSYDLATYGFVNFGYRQVGYPIALAILRTVADWLTIETLLFTAMVQVSLLFLVVGLVALKWSWRGVLLIVALIAVNTRTFPNFILTEGLAMPLAALLALALLEFVSSLDGAEQGRQRRLWIFGATVTLLSILLLSIRYPFAVFGLAPLGVLWASWRTTFRKQAAILFGFYLVMAGALTWALSAENADEYGVFFPTVRGERSAYWATWSIVFTAYPENAEDPELADFYDEGNPYQFIQEVEDSAISYAEQRQIFDDASADLLAAAGLSARRSQLESFLWALRGGRLDDIGWRIDQFAAATRHNIDEAMHANRVSRREGIPAFSESYNQGTIPEAVITSEGALRLPLPDGRKPVAILLPIALVVMAVGIFRPNARVAATVGLLSVVMYAAAMGMVRADNYRFLVTTSVFGLVLATGVGVEMARNWSGRPTDQG
jgi:hypothetical protein